MTKDLSTVTNDDELNEMLHQIAQGGDKQDNLPIVKWASKACTWKISKEKKDENNRTIYEDIGKELAFHMVTSKTQYMENDNSGIYSREFTGRNGELLNNNNEVVFRGTTTEIKAEFGDKVNFCSMLYGFAKIGEEMKMVRLRISGSMCGPWFKFLQEFSKENPVSRKVILFSPGVRMKGKNGQAAVIATEAEIAKFNKQLSEQVAPTDNLFYLIKVEEKIDLDKPKIIENVKAIMEFLSTRKENVSTLEKKVDTLEAEIVSQNDDIDENIPEDPFGNVEEPKSKKDDTTLNF